MKANNGRGFARVADAMGMSWADRVATRTSQFVGDIMMKTSFRPFDRDLSIAGICGAPDGVPRSSRLSMAPSGHHVR